MSPTRHGRGYWLVARDGGIFSFGDAQYHGSMGGRRLNQPINGITTTPTGRGYRMVGRDGGIFDFGDARYHGSLPGLRLRVADVVGMASTPTGKGYWIARSGGQVYAFGDAHNFGDFAASRACDPVTGIFANPKAQGYMLVTASMGIVGYGHVPAGGIAFAPRPCHEPVHVWHDSHGWHVRIQQQSLLRKRVFAGSVHTSGRLVDVRGVHLEGNDTLEVSPSTTTIAFRFNNRGGTDGFDFTTYTAPTLTFRFLRDNTALRTSNIGLGTTGWHPHTNPFTIKTT
jgi:hypothetical protein